MGEPVRITGGDENEGIQAQVTRNGSLCVTDEGWKISDMDITSSGTYKYYGFVDKAGRWYILRETIESPVEYRYYAGTSLYPVGWTARDTLDYDYYYNIF